MALAIICLLYLHQKKQILYHRNLIAIKHDFEKTLLKTQVEIQEQTFSSISKEIHDNISLSLTLAKLNLNTLNWVEVESSTEAVRNSIKIIGSAISDLGNLAKSMNPDMIKKLG